MCVIVLYKSGQSDSIAEHYYSYIPIYNNTLNRENLTNNRNRRFSDRTGDIYISAVQVYAKLFRRRYGLGVQRFTRYISLYGIDYVSP